MPWYADPVGPRRELSCVIQQRLADVEDNRPDHGGPFTPAATDGTVVPRQRPACWARWDRFGGIVLVQVASASDNADVLVGTADGPWRPEAVRMRVCRGSLATSETSRPGVAYAARWSVPARSPARGLRGCAAGRPVVFVGVEARNRQVARPVRRVERDPDADCDPDAWWAGIPAVRAVLDAGLDLPAGVTFLVGENGSGKSTLIEALAQAYGLNAEGGSRGAMHRTRQTESSLGAALRLVRSPGGRGDAYFLRAETTHGLYTYLETLPGSPDWDLHERSHGEGFLVLLERKFQRPGFYLLDEPEAALSFTSTLSLMARLATLADAGAQIVVATHSPVLTALPAASVLELGEHGIRTTAWSDLTVVDHFRAFLDQPDRYLRHLLR